MRIRLGTNVPRCTGGIFQKICLPADWQHYHAFQILRLLQTCLWGGNDSLDFSVHWRKQLPDHLPWYLAVQDGVSESFVGANIENFSGLFMRGSTDFKRQAGKWCDIAHHHGKLFHYGRASTYKRVREARLIGADSIDSVSPVLRCADDPTKVNTKRALTRWIDEALNTNPQGELFQ